MNPNKMMVDVFSLLMQSTIKKSFSFPGGGISQKIVSSCIEALESECLNGLSRERIIDFCICQVYALSEFGPSYLKNWKVSHSFGKKAIERYRKTGSGKKYYEDKWLKKAGLNRENILNLFQDRRKHPLYKFIFPEFEEHTKLRMYNSEVGFYICQISTLLWTPFSSLCLGCKHQQRCIEALKLKFSELYRIRIEEYNNRTGNNNESN